MWRALCFRKGEEIFRPCFGIVDDSVGPGFHVSFVSLGHIIMVRVPKRKLGKCYLNCVWTPLVQGRKENLAIESLKFAELWAFSLVEDVLILFIECDWEMS